MAAHVVTRSLVAVTLTAAALGLILWVATLPTPTHRPPPTPCTRAATAAAQQLRWLTADVPVWRRAAQVGGRAAWRYEAHVHAVGAPVDLTACGATP